MSVQRPSTAGATALRLSGLFVLFAVPGLVWLRLNQAPPNWDDAWYLSNSLVLYDAWTDGGLPGLARQFLAALGFKAPLITALPLPLYWILGRRWHAAYGVNLAAMAVLFLATWGIGRRLRGGRAGLLAVYIAGTLPLLYGLSRWYLVEYPLAATMAVAFWLALAAAEGLGLAYPALLGTAWGLGMLLKSDFPVFALPVTVYVLWRRRDRARVLLAMAVPCFVLAAPWYALHWRATLYNAIAAGFGRSAAVQGTGPVFSARAVAAYLELVAERGVSWYYAILAAGALAVAVFRARSARLRQIAPLGLWAAPFAVFVLGGNKDVRYIAPILPAFALAAACALDAATEGRRWIAPLALVFPLLSFFAVSFGIPYAARDVGYAIRYDRKEWGHDQILTAIADDSPLRYGERKTILLGTDRGRFNGDNFQLFVVRRRLPFRVETTAYTASLDKALEQARRSDYIVYKQGGEPESTFFNLHWTELLARLRGMPEWEDMAFTGLVPDGGTVHILRRR